MAPEYSSEPNDNRLYISERPKRATQLRPLAQEGVGLSRHMPLVGAPQDPGTISGQQAMLDACLFMEETSRGLTGIGGYATTLITAAAMQRFGSEEQKANVLGGITRGDVEAIAMRYVAR